MKTIPRIIEEQVQRWQIMQKEGKEEKEGVSIVTVSREPGSGGRIVATRLSEKLGIDIFHQEVINEMAKRRVMRTESDRRASIRKYFNADIADPTNYDLVINTATLNVDDAVNVIAAALGMVECVLVG
jgi:cytidylate kinase